MITRPITRPVTAPLARAVTANVGNIWNPRALFALGEQGWWFDNNDLSTLFQDAAGTTPVTAAGQPVGLQLDKSRGLVRGSELVANGDFSSGTAGWSALNGTIAAESGGLTVTNTAAAEAIAFTGSVVAGRWYEVTVTVTQASLGGAVVVGGTRTGLGGIGTKTRILLASASGTIQFGTNSATVGHTVKIDNVSVRELPGNHRFQATAASRPILRQNATTGAYYFETDGSDDWMQTNAVNFTGTDKVTLFTGGRKLSDAATGVLVEFSVDSGIQSGAFALFVPRTASGNNIGLRSRGTLTVEANAPGVFASPVSFTAALECSIGGDIGRLRVNGAQTAATSADQGTGDYGNYPAYFFRRGGTTLPFTGHEYGSICVGRLCSAAEISAVERLLAQRVGVALA